jgi:hypothetical protein
MPIHKYITKSECYVFDLYSQSNNSERWLAENGLIPEDDLPRIAKSRFTTSQNWPGPDTSITVI